MRNSDCLKADGRDVALSTYRRTSQIAAQRQKREFKPPFWIELKAELQGVVFSAMFHKSQQA